MTIFPVAVQRCHFLSNRTILRSEKYENVYENHIALFAPFLQEHCWLHELEQKEIEKAQGHLYVDQTKKKKTQRRVNRR